MVRAFENRISTLVVTNIAWRCAIARSIGLEIAIRAAGLGGEVIVPAFTFVATVHALQWQEITPVFCDVDPDTH
ncbi:MAG: DegT/DnrJ/EryC1/StrS family aminotransferase [Planctomycetota bacterium]